MTWGSSTKLLFISTACSLVLPVTSHNDYEPEPRKWKHVPTKIPGSYQVYSPPEGACNETCTIPTRIVLDRFKQYTYFNYYEFMKDKISSYPYERAGIRHCEEAEEALQCYEDCNRNQTILGLPDDNPIEIRFLRRLVQKYCEKQYTPGYPYCRLADTRGCDSHVTKTNCGQELEHYELCIDLTIANTYQNCSGFCTPARRFYQASRFMWRMECRLAQAAQTQCATFVSYNCFNKIKDTDTNMGLYEEFHLNETYTNNMPLLCQIFEEALDCMDTTMYGWFDFFGFNVSQPCSDIESEMREIQAEWRELVTPFCNNPNTQGLETWTYDDVCPEPAPLPLLPSTPHYHPVFTSPTSTVVTRRALIFDEHETTTSVTKSGSCPSSEPTNDCGAFCTNDGECPRRQKCCDSCCRAVMRQRIPKPNRRTTPVMSGKPRQDSGSVRLEPGILVLLTTILAGQKLPC